MKFRSIKKLIQINLISIIFTFVVACADDSAQSNSLSGSENKLTYSEKAQKIRDDFNLAKAEILVLSKRESKNFSLAIEKQKAYSSGKINENEARVFIEEMTQNLDEFYLVVDRAYDLGIDIISLVSAANSLCDQIYEVEEMNDFIISKFKEYKPDVEEIFHQKREVFIVDLEHYDSGFDCSNVVFDENEYKKIIDDLNF